jgi:hypothetical protein
MAAQLEWGKRALVALVYVVTSLALRYVAVIARLALGRHGSG